MEFLKDAFYKFCFCLGLGTASYYSYAQVQHWVQPVVTSAPVIAPTSFIQDKVNALQQTPEGAVALVREVIPNSALPAHRPMVAQITAPALTNSSEVNASPSPGASPGDAVVSASPSPSASPGSTEAVAANANGENPQATPTPGENVDANGQPIANAGVAVTAAPGVDYVPQYDYSQQAQVVNQNAQATAPAIDQPNAAADVPLVSPYAASLAAGQPEAAANGAASSGTIGSTSHDTPSAGYTPSTSASTSSLSAQDISWISGTSVKASFGNVEEEVSGQYCGQGTSSGSCTQESRMPVYPNRWGTTEGLETAATLSMRASGNSLIEFDLTFKLQSSTLTEQSVVLSIPASSVSVTSSSQNGLTYKTYNFTLPNTTALGQSLLSQMQASLVYEITTGGTVESAVLVSSSTLTFTRTKVTTVEQSWDPTSASRSPAANSPYVVADSIQYSLGLQKQ
jgi:hypothetical protein